MLSLKLRCTLDNTAKEYCAHSDGQGKDLVKGTKALASAAGSIGEVTASAIEIFLDPFRVTIYGYNKLKEKFIPKVIEYLENIPSENLVSPEESIAGPLLEAAKFKTNDTEISNLFAALLTSSMDTRVKSHVHPSYVQIINEMSSDEAKILKYLSLHNLDSYPILDLYAREAGEKISKKSILSNFTDIGYKAGCENPDMTATHIDNLSRLKLIDIPLGTSLSDKSRYVALREHEILKPWLEKIKEKNYQALFDEGVIKITSFGYGFIYSCKID